MNYLRLDMRPVFLSAVLIFVAISCETAIVFTEPQPVGTEKLAEFPQIFHGNYFISETEDGVKFESPGPALMIRKDSLAFFEYKTAELHKNYVDGASYQLIDGYLYRDSRRISAFPPELKGDHYHYISRIDTMAFVLKDNKLVIDAKDSVLALEAEVHAGPDYFAVNLFSEFKDSTWVCYVFQQIPKNKLELRVSPAFKKLNEKTMVSVYKATINEERTRYLVAIKSRADFERLVDQVFKSILTVRKK